MARYVLLSQIRTEARQSVGYENNPHTTDSELASVIRNGARQLLDLLLEVHGPEPYREQTFLQIVESVSVYDLPTWIHQVLRVYACDGEVTYSIPVEGTGTVATAAPAKPYVTLRPFEEEERAPLLNATYSDYKCLRYRLGGREAENAATELDPLAIDEECDQIELLPVPSATRGIVYLSVIRQPTMDDLVDGDTRVLAPGAGKDWLIAHTAAYILKKEKDFEAAAAKMQERAEAEVRIKAAHARRDTNEPRRMVGRRDDWPRRGDFAEDWED